MPSTAHGICVQLWQQVDDLRSAAQDQEQIGNEITAAVMRRACILLTVASFDTYFHERGISLLTAHAATGSTEADAVSNYCGQSKANVTGTSAQGYIRLGLSFKTLVAPEKVDKLLAVTGVDTGNLWTDTAVAMGSRPAQIRRLLELQYDRRNQIAHGADWDSSVLDFRPVSDLHVLECLNHIRSLVDELDKRL